MQRILQYIHINRTRDGSDILHPFSDRIEVSLQSSFNQPFRRSLLHAYYVIRRWISYIKSSGRYVAKLADCFNFLYALSLILKKFYLAIIMHKSYLMSRHNNCFLSHRFLEFGISTYVNVMFIVSMLSSWYWINNFLLKNAKKHFVPWLFHTNQTPNFRIRMSAYFFRYFGVTHNYEKFFSNME